MTHVNLSVNTVRDKKCGREIAMCAKDYNCYMNSENGMDGLYLQGGISLEEECYVGC